jgi:hypothetical protein
MWPVALAIPDAVSRDQFADRLAHKAKLSETTLRDQLRDALAKKKTTPPPVLTAAMADNVRLAEKGLLWTFMHHPVEGLAALAQLEPDDLDGLVTRPIFRLVQSLAEMPPEMLPTLIRERLSEGERALLERAALGDQPGFVAAECVNALKRHRIERALADIQEEIDRLQDQSAITDDALSALWKQKNDLLRQLEALKSGN